MAEHAKHAQSNGMKPFKLFMRGMQAKGGMKGLGLEELKGFEIDRAQIRMPLKPFRLSTNVGLRKNQRERHLNFPVALDDLQPTPQQNDLQPDRHASQPALP